MGFRRDEPQGLANIGTISDIDFRAPAVQSRRFAKLAEATVPDLTHSANINLNNGVSLQRSGRSVASARPDIAHRSAAKPPCYLNRKSSLVSQMNSRKSSSPKARLEQLRISSATFKQRLDELQRLRDQVRITEQRARRAPGPAARTLSPSGARK